jgi:hypothetical protein
MDFDDSHIESAVLAIGLIVACAIIWVAFPYASDSPTGFAVAASSASCCGDCSCAQEGICAACGGCIWTTECSVLSGSLNPEGLELVGPATVGHDSDFTLNAVFQPDQDGMVLLSLSPPNAFEMQAANPQVVRLKAGQTQVVPLKVHVLRYVAKGEHQIRVDSAGTDFKPLSSATATVKVWWGE